MKIGVIILAAGRGKRLNSTTVNKVMLPLSGKPMLSFSVSLFEKMNLKPIIAVVGFAKEGIIDYFKDRIHYVSQNHQLGTADAVWSALPELPADVKDVLIVNGDDSYAYSPKLINRLIKTHIQTKSAITLLTIEKLNPKGLGRIIRNKKGAISAIVEEKDATDREREITEVNPQCWIFKVSFLKKYLPKIAKSPVTGEYYLTDAVKLTVANGEHIADVKAGNIPWRGVNTREELEEAKHLMSY